MINMYRLSITIKSPYLFPSESSEFGYDSTQSNFSRKDTLPGSQIKGILRHQLKNIGFFESDDLLSELFGLPDATGNNSKIKFADTFIEDIEVKKERTIVPLNRIQIDNKKGTVKHGQIQVIKTFKEVNSSTTFAGNIHIDSDHINIQQIVSILKSIPSIGSNKSVGYGEILNVDWADIAPNKPMISSISGDCIGFSFELDGALSIGLPSTSNYIRTKTFIPGSSIIANLSKYIDSDEQDELSKLYCSNAICGHRRQVHPFHIFKEKGTDLRFFNAFEDTSMGTNSGNFKPSDYAQLKNIVEISDYSPKISISTRTEIDHENYLAKEGNLFTTEKAIVVNDIFTCTLDFSRVTEEFKAQVLEILQTKYFFIGKQNTVIKNPKITPSSSNLLKKTASNGRYIIELLSSTKMFDYDSYRTNDILELYQAYFSNLLGDCKLVDFYAQQEMHGGSFHGLKSNNSYNPEILTCAGSTFYVEMNNTQLDKISSLPNHCLPVFEQFTWRKSVVQPTNGFGEFKIHSETSLEDL